METAPRVSTDGGVRAISERHAEIVATRSFAFPPLEGGPDSLEGVRGHLAAL